MMVRNGNLFDYPYSEALSSMAYLVDELIINVGISDDGTLATIEGLARDEPKIRIIQNPWPLEDSSKTRGGLILSEQTNLALQECTGDWCFHLQADELLHEKDFPIILDALSYYKENEDIEGLLFDYVHFYGSYDVIQESRSAYRREVRIIKRNSGARSVGDAQSFRKADGSKLRVVPCGAKIYHYGWVRAPHTMKDKTTFMDQLYHGTFKVKEGALPTGDNYRYKKFWGLKPFKGSHSRFMKERIAQKGWNWDLASSPLVWSYKDLSKILLDCFEKLTGNRLFEYRSYEQVTPKINSDDERPLATLILATYEMPHHLSLVLAALRNQSATSYEVIVCDDGSGEETKQLIDDFVNSVTFRVSHIWQENKGFRKCRILNQGLNKALGKTAIFLDGDCIPHRHFVKDHLALQKPGTYVAGRRVELGQKISAWLSSHAIEGGFFDRPSLRMLLSVVFGGSEHFQRTIRYPWKYVRKLLGMLRIDDMKGCNFSVSMNALRSINGFDEDFEGYGREDTDVEIRLQNLGFKIQSAKGLALQFHAWHPRREFTPSNEGRLEEVIKSKKVRCKSGMAERAKKSPPDSSIQSQST